MIDLKEFLEICEYKVTGGSTFGWQCFGPHAYIFDAGDFEQENTYSLSITFDTKNQTPYCVEVCDYKNNRAYRMFNPDYSEAYHNEAKARGVSDTAWDDTNYIDIDLDEDFVEKARAIVAGLPYSTKLMVPLDITHQELHELMLIAHERDVTLNQLVNFVLEAYCAAKS